MTPPLLLALLFLCSHTARAFVTPLTRRSTSQNTNYEQHARPTSATTTTTTTALRMEVIECDVAIVGGGPAACTCALYTSRADLSTVILDKNPASGALAITSHIANYPGVDKAMTGLELLERMKVQAVLYGTRYERSQVFMIDVNKDETGDDVFTKCIYTPDLTVKARSIVLASGAMGRTGKPFPGEAEFLGSGVSYCATCDGAFYRDEVVAVVGASTEAIEEALFLTKFAKKVHWITSVDISPGSKRNTILDQDMLAQLLACDNVEHLESTRFVDVLGDMSGVSGVTIKRKGDTEPEVIEVTGAFIYGAGGGSKPITDFCQAKVDLDEGGGVIVDANMNTSCEGVFAIGDIRNTEYKQVVVAASDGCIAAMSIEKFLNNRKTVKLDWKHT